MSTTYTADQIDNMLAQQMFEISDKIDKVIVMASPEYTPSPAETSLYMQVVSKDERE